MTDFIEFIPTAVDAALALNKECMKNKKLLDDTARVFMQISLHKVPVVEETRRVYVHLDHCHAGNSPDICIFTQNAWPNDHIVRPPDDKIEYSIDHYEKIFKDHKIKGISAIMPVKQLRNEYGPFELKRKLVNRFDLFLADTALLRKQKFTKALGKTFSKANKFPVGVKFPQPGEHDKNFKNRIEKAIKTAYFSIKPYSNSYSIPVGVTSHTREQLIENATQLSKQIVENNAAIPGGFGNVQSILLKTELSKAVPLYRSLESRNNVPVPYVKAKQPLPEPVEGELSTRPGMKVTVMPDGEVIIEKADGEEGNDVSDSEDDEEEEEDDESDDSGEEVKKESKTEKEKKKNETNDEDDSEDEDDVAENAEQKYLSDWLNDVNEEEEENKEDEIKEDKQKGKKSNKGKKRKLEDDENSKTDGKKLKNSKNQAEPGTKKQKKSDKGAKVQVSKKKLSNNPKESPKMEIKRKSNKGSELSASTKNLSNKQKESPKIEKGRKSDKGNKASKKNVLNKQKESPKMEKIGKKNNNLTGKRKKPTQLKNKK